jgi:nucleotide-binding universal stress UspA family protein
MAKAKRILIAADASQASRQAVDYVVQMVRGRPEFHVALLHLELPPRMLEWGGSESPQVEEGVSQERAEDYRRLEKDALEEGRALLETMKKTLVDNGIDVAALFVKFDEPLDPKQIADDILKTASERDYGTVVVGRHTLSGLKRWFQHYVGEELVRIGKGVTVWVVE